MQACPSHIQQHSNCPHEAEQPAQQRAESRAHSSPVTQSTSTAASTPDDVPMADYLALLAQISPAARDGAQAYLRAFARRCGRPLTALELRKAIAQGSGDPVLMGMVSASHPSQLAQRDALLNQLAQRIRCDGRGQP